MKKILVILIFVLVFYLALSFALNFLFPEKIGQAAREFVGKTFGRKITISHININILRGVYLKDTTIFETDRKTPYLKIKTIRLVPFYPSLLSNKKLFLSVNMEGVYFTIKRNTDNTFNFPQIQQTPQADIGKEKKKTKPNADIFLVKSLSMKKLNFDFVDATVDFKKKFEDVTVFASLGASPGITAKISWQDKLRVNAEYNLLSKELSVSALLKEIAVGDFNSYLPQVTFKDGYIKDGKISLEGKENYSLKVDANLAKLFLIKEKAEVKGKIHTTMQINFSPENITYTMQGSLSDGFLKLAPYLDSLTSIKGAFELDNKKMRLIGLSADFSTESKEKNKDTQPKIPLTANAEINFETSQIVIGAETHPQIAELVKALKNIGTENLKFFKNFDYKGSGDIGLKATVKTNLKNDYFEYYIDYNIKGAKYNDLEDIQANGFIANSKLEIENFSLKHKNIAWQGNFQLNDFSSPDIKLSAHSALLNLDFSAKQLKDLIAIKNLTIKTKDSQIKAEGGWHKEKQQLELQGLAYIALSEIAPITDTYKIKIPWLVKAAPQGTLNTKFMITGPLTPAKWQIKLAGLCEKLKIYNLEASEAKLEFYKDSDLLIISPLVASLAQGKVDLRTKIDYPKKRIVVNVLANEVDLAVLAKQLKLNNSSLGGILSLEANLENDDFTSLDKLTGSGKVSIREGNIWEINFLKGMGEFLFIPEFEQIKFEDGYSDLVFKGENVGFENIELKSFQMNLRGKGRISLKGDLNFMLVSEFNPDLISSSQTLKGFFTNVLSKTSLTIEVKGTVKNPTYKVQPVIFSDLEGFKKIFEGIFQ